jgi:hypothetical protein
MLKKALLIALLFIHTPHANAACIGYENNISALEAVMANHHKTQKSQYKSIPLTASIDHSLTALEKAIKDHKAAQTTKTTTK